MITRTTDAVLNSYSNLVDRGQRAWEGRVAGKRWIAQAVYVDERTKICALHVAAGDDRDSAQKGPNCHWDYEYDRLVRRHGHHRVPPEVETAMLDSVREWLRCFLLNQRKQQDSVLTIRPGPARQVPTLPSREVTGYRISSPLD